MTKSLCIQSSNKADLPLGRCRKEQTGKKRLEIFESPDLSKWYKEYLETCKDNKKNGKNTRSS